MTDGTARLAECLHDDGRHRVTLFRAPGGSRRTVICFEPGRTNMSGYDQARCPHFAERLGVDALTVQTARRDWFVAGGTGNLARVLAQVSQQYDEVTASGFSMGGYGALLYSAAARVRRALLISPQYSVDPVIAPYDPERHEKFRSIGFPMPLPQEMGDTALTGVLIYDPMIPSDRQHALNIARAFPRLRLRPLPYGGHPATSVIGDAGRVGQISAMLVEGRLDLDIIRQLHRDARRGSPRYRLHLAREALRRHPARAGAVLLQLAESGADQIRFEAGLALLAVDEEAGAACLSRLMDECPNPPPFWSRRIQAALARGIG